MNQTLRNIFRKGSKTYFTSSLFFPKKAREDVFKLYGFVRVADDYVDQVPPDTRGFENFLSLYRQACARGSSGNVVVDSFVELAGRLEFDPAWTEAFLHSMSLDLEKARYKTMEETLEYIYGSAEVIGLYMARIMGLPETSHPHAMMQGRAMQMINFIRDIQEDLALGRVYLPLEGRDPDLLLEEKARRDPEAFQAFIREMLGFYNQWQREAEKGYGYIPKRFLIPVKTASDMYNWTARAIEKDPWVVYTRKVKPSRGRILLQILSNSITISTGRVKTHAGLFQGTKAQN